MASLADLGISISAHDGKFATTMRGLPAKANEAVDGIVGRFKAMAPALEKAAQAGGAVAAAGLVYGATKGLEKEAAGDKLAAQLRLSDKDSKAAGKLAGKLYAGAYGESLEEVNTAVAGIVSSNLAELGDAKGVERLSAKALDLAATFDGDVSDGIARASALIDSGLAKNADEAFDLIVASSQKVPLALRDELGDATKEYSKFFGDLGIAGTDALGLLASASDQFTLDKTGDSIGEFAKLVVDTGSTAAPVLEQLGLDAGKMSTAIAQGGPKARAAFDQIVDGLRGIEDPGEQARASIATFGTPLEDLGVSKIPEFLDSLDTMGGGLGDVTGRADELGDTLNKNGKTRVEGFKRKVEGMLAKVTEAPGIFGDAAVAVGGMGQVLEPFGPALAAAGVLFKDQLGDMAKSAGKSTGKAAKAVAKGSSKAVAALARWVAAGAVWVAQMVAQGAKALASMVITAAQFTAKYAMMAAKALVNAGKIAASWIIAMGPIAIAIAAVVAIVAVIVKNWDTIKAVTGKVWNWFYDKVSGVVGTVVDTIKGAHERMVNIIRGAFDKVRELIGSAWDAVLGAIRRYIDLMITVYVRIPQRIVSALGNLAGLLVGKGRDTIDGMRKGAVNAFESVKSWLGGMAGRVLRAVGDLARTLWNAGKALMQGLLDGIKKGFEKVDSYTGGIAGTIADLKGPLPYDRKVLIDNGKALMFGLDRGMKAGMQSVMSTAGSIADTISGAMRPAGTVGIAGATSAMASPDGGGRGGMHFHAPVTFGERHAVRELDLWARGNSSGM